MLNNCGLLNEGVALLILKRLVEVNGKLYSAEDNAIVKSLEAAVILRGSFTPQQTT
jgi:hypothetical protein